MSQLPSLLRPGTCGVWKIPLPAWLLPLWLRPAVWTLPPGPSSWLQCLREVLGSSGRKSGSLTARDGLHVRKLGSIPAFDLGAASGPPWDIGTRCTGSGCCQLKHLWAILGAGQTGDGTDLGFLSRHRPHRQPGGQPQPSLLSWSAGGWGGESGSLGLTCDLGQVTSLRHSSLLCERGPFTPARLS